MKSLELLKLRKKNMKDQQLILIKLKVKNFVTISIFNVIKLHEGDEKILSWVLSMV